MSRSIAGTTNRKNELAECASGIRTKCWRDWKRRYRNSPPKKVAAACGPRRLLLRISDYDLPVACVSFTVAVNVLPVEAR